MVTFPTGVFDLPLSLSTISFRTIEKTRLAKYSLGISLSIKSEYGLNSPVRSAPYIP